MHFEWDEKKRAANLAKHDRDFADLDRFEWAEAFIEVDDRNDYAELREVAYGFFGDSLHVVVFADHEDVRRILSFRKATKKEMKHYAANV